MGDAGAQDLTVLLREWSSGNKSAFREIAAITYAELRKLAAGRLRGERSGHTLQPTALIHETYLRLVNHDQAHWHSRAHFFSVASTIRQRD